MSACTKFNRIGRAYPVLYQVEAIKEILKKSSTRGKSMSPRETAAGHRNGRIGRTSSCIPAITRDVCDPTMVKWCLEILLSFCLKIITYNFFTYFVVYVCVYMWLIVRGIIFFLDILMFMKLRVDLSIARRIWYWLSSTFKMKVGWDNDEVSHCLTILCHRKLRIYTWRVKGVILTIVLEVIFLLYL